MTNHDFETKYNTWHKYTSYIKSGVRLVGCGAALLTGSVVVLAIFFAAAEVVGIVEEWV